MANFWDLPRSIRDEIYRLHLVHDGKTTAAEHRQLVVTNARNREKKSPPVCLVSAKAEKEAAPIYYGENHFAFSSPYTTVYLPGYGPDSLAAFVRTVLARHLRLVERITVDWPQIGAHFDFEALHRLKGLKELYIGVHEYEMVVASVFHRYASLRMTSIKYPPTAQEQMTLLKHPGMSTLLRTKGLPSKIQFVRQERTYSGPGEGGPLSGGFLETYVLPKLTGSDDPKAGRERKQDDSFRFMDLPPEIRNRVYRTLFHIDGAVQLSQERPSSIGRNLSDEKKATCVQSVLSVLGVNRQIHDEAVGIFYYINRLEFSFPSRLHAFINSLSTPRLGSLRDITFHYYNVKNGGINLIDLTMPVLKQLSLRRLHIICGKEICGVNRFTERPHYHVDRTANPLAVPGMRFLFNLRGIKDILVRDTRLEEEIQHIVETYPNSEKRPIFDVATKQHFYTELAKILAQFNGALADAQFGKVNKVMLEDMDWHLKAPFPTTKDGQLLGDRGT